MSNETLVISGGTKGLGRDISIRFAEKGYKVIALFSKDFHAASEIESYRLKCKGKITTQHCDIRSFINSQNAIKFKENLSGKITLINNAVNPFQPKPMHLVTAHEINEQWEVTVSATFFLSISLAKEMINGESGTIVNILTPLIEEKNVKGFSSYLMAKQGLQALTKVQASEFNPMGVRVLSISPPFMKTNLTNSWNHALTSKMGSSKINSTKKIASIIYNIVTENDNPGTGENYIIN